MIYTDGVHLITTGSIAELHSFAKKLGLKREWFQNHRIPHYDLTTVRARDRAVVLGARRVKNTRELVRLLKESQQ